MAAVPVDSRAADHPEVPETGRYRPANWTPNTTPITSSPCEYAAHKSMATQQTATQRTPIAAPKRAHAMSARHPRGGSGAAR